MACSQHNIAYSQDHKRDLNKPYPFWVYSGKKKPRVLQNILPEQGQLRFRSKILTTLIHAFLRELVIYMHILPEDPQGYCGTIKTLRTSDPFSHSKVIHSGPLESHMAFTYFVKTFLFHFFIIKAVLFH